MIRILTCLALAASALSIWPKAAEAAESYDGCTGFINSLPATISTQGTWCLNKNLSTSVSSGGAITIATNNVTIDCNGFKIGGLAAGAGTHADGIRATTRRNATIRNCNIRGFNRGVYLAGSGSSGHLVEDNNFDGNTRFGVFIVESPGSAVRNNQVLDTGGSSIAGPAYGIHATRGVDVIGNTVNGVAPTPGNAAIGISTYVNNAGSVVGNRVRGLAPTNGGSARGIYNDESGRTVIFENIVQGPGSGVAGSVGIHCASNWASARNNMVLGFATGIRNCLSSANSVNNN